MLKLPVIVLCALFAVCGCSGSRNTSAVTSAPHGARIVSLMPSFTEDLVAIGAGRQIVAVDQFSTDVPGARSLPVVANFSSVNTERIVQLHGSLIVAIPAQDRFLVPLRRAGVQRALLTNDSFGDIFRNIEALGALTGHPRQAAALEKSLHARTARLHASIHFRRAPTVFVVLDTSPIYTVGPKSYISDLIRLAGGRDAAADLHAAYAPYSAEALLRLQPDVIITDKSTRLQRVLQTEPWKSLRAVAQRHVFTIDSADILERPGPRYNEGLAWLVERLQRPAK
ncbi:MAG: helical backbone metal receptor [Candidatus Eremiobacteraeota bacterium]|nr:helical backbone metal receptor [Candidatus Eremiobacteraeota bacterium]